MTRRRCCCCCGGESCTPWTEAWAYPAGPVPDPPWTAPFGPGSELLASGAGTAVGPFGISARAYEGVHYVAGAVNLVSSGQAVLAALNATLNGGGLSLVGTAGAPNTWALQTPDGMMTPLPIFDGEFSVSYEFQWNDDGDWSVALDGVTFTQTGTGMAVIGGSVLGTVVGDGSLGPITTACLPLPPP